MLNFPKRIIIYYVIDYLVKWSRNKTRQKLIEQETNNKLTLIEPYQQEEISKSFSISHQSDVYNNLIIDDERKLSNLSKEHEILHPIHTNNISRYIHTHETACGFNDSLLGNQEYNKIQICNDGNMSSLTFLSNLKDKLIKCDES